jgi:flagellar biosynthesis protein FlhB
MVSYRAKHVLSIVADLLSFTGAILVVVSIFGTNVDQLERLDDHDKVEKLISSIQDNQKYTVAGLVAICIAAFLRAILLHIFEFLDHMKNTKK